MRTAARALALLLGFGGAWLAGAAVPAAPGDGEAQSPVESTSVAPAGAALPIAAVQAASAPIDSALRDLIDRTAALRRAGAGDSALALLEPVLTELESAADSLNYAVLLTHKGRLLRRLGRAREAEPILRQAVARAEANRDSFLLCDALLQLGNTLDALGRDPRAIPVYQRLIAAAQAASDTAHVARGQLYLGRRAQSAGDFDQARSRLQAAHAAFQKLGLEADELTSAFMLALVNAQTGNLAAAHATWLETREMARRLENPMMEAGSLTNLGSLEIAVGDPGVAVDLWLQAENLYRTVGRSRAAIHPAVSAANALVMLGRYERADSLLKRQILVAREQGYTDLEADVVMALGGMEHRRRQYSAAAGFYREAWSLVRGTNIVEQQLNALIGLSVAVAARGSTEAALALLERHAEPLRARVSPQRQIHLDLRLARHELDAGRHTAALHRLVRAERGAERGGYLNSRIEALPLAATAYEKLGEPDSALTCLQRAARVWEAERSVPKDAEWREQRGELGARVFTRAAHLVLTHPTPRPQAERTREAFELLQRFKTRTLLERMTGPSRTGDTLQAVPAPVNLARLQAEVLRDDELLVDTFVGPEVSYLFAVTREVCRPVRLPGLEEGLEAKLALWSELLSTPPARSTTAGGSETATESLARLHDLLFGEIGDLLDLKRRILYLPDGPLNRIAISALAPHAVEAPLLSRHEVVRVPSATVLTLVRLRARGIARPEERRILAMAGSTTPDGAILAGAVREVRALARRFRGVDARVVTRASEPLAEGALEDYDVLHFAAHTTVDDQQPWRSGILLAGAGGPGMRGAEVAPRTTTLRAARIAGMRLPARLAVLSGCGSAHGRLLSGEGVLGLTNAFLSAGVPAVVATLWPVDDAMTAHLMGRLYAHLEDGATAAAALRRAQLDLLASASASHPFYWAGFVLVGNGDLRVELHPRRRVIGPAAGAVAVLFVVAAVWRARRLRRRQAELPHAGSQSV